MIAPGSRISTSLVLLLGLVIGWAMASVAAGAACTRAPAIDWVSRLWRPGR